MAYTNHAKIVRPKWDPSTLPSLEDKLALKGAQVYIRARSLAKAQSGIDAMLQESPSLSIENFNPLVMDLGDLKQVQAVAEKFVRDGQRLDILVNNAGLLPGPLELDDDGISTQMVLNHLAPMLFTLMLLPLLKRTALRLDKQTDVCIVNVNSTSHVDAPPTGRFSSLADFNATFPTTENGEVYTRYGHSKLANALFRVELQHRLTAEKVPVIVTYTHPGGVGTAGSAKFLGGRDNDVFRDSLTPYEGALTPLWCAAGVEVRENEDKWSGKYVLPFGGSMEGNKRVEDEELRTECWEGSERIMRKVLEV